MSAKECCNQDCNQGRDCPLRKVEPIAWIIDVKMTDCDDNFIWNTGDYPDWQVKDWIPLYTHPVKELRDEEIHDLMDEIRQAVGDDIERAMYRMARAILRKAQEK